jgi:hypothetical protein
MSRVTCERNVLILSYIYGKGNPSPEDTIFMAKASGLATYDRVEHFSPDRVPLSANNWMRLRVTTL